MFTNYHNITTISNNLGNLQILVYTRKSTYLIACHTAHGTLQQPTTVAKTRLTYISTARPFSVFANDTVPVGTVLKVFETLANYYRGH